VTRVSILPEPRQGGETRYRAIAADHQTVGKTPGEALDALTALLPASDAGTLIVVQNLRPDALFTAQQQERLRTLMERWRTARDSGDALPPEEHAELEALTDAELRAATARAAALLTEIQP
jgi:hypothetical protein